MRRLVWMMLMGGLWGLVWAQEESRHREGMTPAPKPPQTQPAPVPRQPEVVMEMLSGTILDKNENAIPNARIWLVDKSTGKVLGETRSDESGNYAVAVPRVSAVILRVSVDGKAFMEKEFSFDTLLSSSDIIFDP